MKFTRFLELYKTFGADIAFSALGASRFRRAYKLKHKCILRYLKQRYSRFIAGYECSPSIAQTDNNIPAIWTMWWQGTENLPDIVKICYSGFRKYCGIHPVKVLTRENFSDYVDLPGYIFDRVNSGAITITHLLDIVRFYLLYHYGGLWLDSTIYITNGIPESVFEAEYYSVKRRPTPRSTGVAQAKWTNFLHAAKKGSELCGFVVDFFLEYWKTQNTLIDYFLIDYAIKIAYDELPECRKIIDAVPYVNYDLYMLERIMNHEWSAEKWELLKNSTNFSKLDWRKPGKMATLLGKDTIYSHLLAESESGGSNSWI
ncbi:MAG: capsular polysaccharide synthesis protein [Synergistaceae bacterium]|nr:capsular polysaccharide synthesis protein [Synergistaceae bacterium]